METLAPCIGCLLGCVPNMFAGKPITCAVNPCVGRECELSPAPEKKRVTVVGGGPGGLYAAWACAVRGHQVTLVEKSSELGGNFRIAAYSPVAYCLTDCGADQPLCPASGCEPNGTRVWERQQTER